MIQIGDKVRIVQNINGDNTPIGTTGEIVDIYSDSTVLISLDDTTENGGEYWTSIDGVDFEVI